MKEVQRTLLPPYVDELAETDTWEVSNMPEVMLLINAEGSAFNIQYIFKITTASCQRPLGWLMVTDLTIKVLYYDVVVLVQVCQYTHSGLPW